MHAIVIEQARFRRNDNGTPTLQARSPGFQDDWLPRAERLIVGFGIRASGVACPLAVLAQPLGVLHVAIVQVTDLGDQDALHFRVLVCPRPEYEQFWGDPFALARQFPPAWQGSAETLSAPRQPAPRSVAQVQKILRRVKAAALKEDEDPEHPDFEHTIDNSESPALLGGVQALVEGGKLVFERSAPDPDLMEGLWTLLPQATRARLWPASFAFSNLLGFDALVVPRLHAADFEGYISEEQAADYPAGQYEIDLQVAAETGNQRDLDALLQRRTGDATFRLGWTLLVAVIFLALTPTLLNLWKPPSDPTYKAAAAAGMIASGNPWTVLGLNLYGDMLWKK
jgi:hypothetical protein